MKKLFLAIVTTLVTGASTVPAVMASTQEVPAPVMYDIKSGDTLWAISEQTGLSIAELEKANPKVNPEDLSVGEPLSIPTVKASYVIAFAKHYLGKVHYVYGGTTPKGFDCSGFVQYMFAKKGIMLPRTVKEMALVGEQVPASQLKKGDLIFFSGTNGSEPGLTHIGIYVANGWFIEQSSDYNNIIMARLWGNPFYKNHFAEARRLLSVSQ